MKLVKLGAAALNQTPLAWENNKANICSAIARAQAQDVDILCLPELCVSGYGCEDFFLAHGTIETSEAVLLEVLPKTQNIIVALGLPLLYMNGVFNAVCVIANGKIQGFVCKQNLAGDGIHYEPRWFKAWPENQRAEFDFAGETLPLGDLYFQMSGVRLGLEICEDAWVAKRPGRRFSDQGIDIILNPSASHFAFGKQAIRRGFVLDGSRAFNASYVYANLAGCEAGRAIYDGGSIIASSGKVVAQGKRFSFQDVCLTTATVDLNQTRMLAAKNASYMPVVGNDKRFVHCKFDFHSHESPSMSIADDAGFESSERVKMEEFARASALGLFDYCRKSHSKGYVVSLSGGADSTAVACLVSLMVDLACAELGLAVFKQKFAYMESLQPVERSNLLSEMLTCVYQATKNSSNTTRHAAEAVSQALGANYLEFEIDKLVEDYEKMVSDGLGRKLSWATDDLSLQNIQARVRAPGVWLLANIKQAILLSTSNRSEAAVGYATMDGDTCGGLSPIAGIDKAFLREWLQWMQTTGVKGLQPVPALKWVNEQQPSAELRPQKSMQTDENDLMPYIFLDALERLAIRDKRTPLDAYILLIKQFAGQYNSALIANWIQKFYRLWCRNQWKRERYAPSFHIDDENLDPKTWCRFPILSGGFERELRELDEFIAKNRG